MPAVGLAKRMLELTIEQVKSKGSLGMTRSMAHHPHVRTGVADMVIGLEAIGAQLESVTQVPPGQLVADARAVGKLALGVNPDNPQRWRERDEPRPSAPS